MKLLTFQSLGQNRETPRFWIESGRLNALNFSPGTRLTVQASPERLTIRAGAGGDNTVSSRRIAGGIRPIIDLNAKYLDVLTGFDELKVSGSCGELVVTPSVRAFNILRSRVATYSSQRLSTFEFFPGGGTLSEAARASDELEIVGGLEINPDYADVWAKSHPEATLVQGCIRRVHPSELPDASIYLAGIPCDEHSTQGITKKSLAGRPETGKKGDLCIPVLQFIAYRMPLGVVLENVPNYGKSLAGEMVKGYLEKLGYHVTETIIEPNEQWNEISNRRRWVLIASLRPGFQLFTPLQVNTTPLSHFLDEPNEERDRADVAKIATTVAGLHVSRARHAAKGNGFRLIELDGTETSIPVIAKSYHKIQSPLLKTAFGLRQLRQSELERIHGCQVATDHYATAVQILGQGVQTRVFTQILNQLGKFLKS